MKKTPENRARELYKMVHGVNFYYAANHDGWLKLGRFVLDLEKKWIKAKKRKPRLRY